MVVSIARQSVIIKCNMQASIMLGNYELYYGAGLFCKIKGITVDEDILPEVLFTFILTELEGFVGANEQEKYLAKILKNYKLEEGYDEQMKELLQMGLNEAHMWQVNV